MARGMSGATGGGFGDGEDWVNLYLDKHVNTHLELILQVRRKCGAEWLASLLTFLQELAHHCSKPLDGLIPNPFSYSSTASSSDTTS